MATGYGQFIVGDGSGGGGASSGGGSGHGGAGGGDNDTLYGTNNNDVIFGDGSGGGGGSSYTSSTYFGGLGGAGGGGNDTLFGGAGNDILFGDGFSGAGGTGVSNPSGINASGGAGGLGGGGGGGTDRDGTSLTGGKGGYGGGSGGKGPQNGYASLNGVSGGTFYGAFYAGGGGGFGVTGTGGNASGGVGGNGGTSVYSIDDTYNIHTNLLGQVTAGNIYNSTVGTTNGYGAGNDTLDGGAGSDHYFGMGGSDTFVVSAQDNAATDVDTIWDFNRGEFDLIQLENASGNILSSAELDNLLNPANAYINITGSDTTLQMLDGSSLVIKGVTDLTAADFLVACFLPGTQFETIDGPKAIETLQRGEMMKSADGYAPLKWLAKRDVNWSMSIPRRVAPVLVKQGALGKGLPLRDLYVSPAHAFEIDGVLINAELLVNGDTIVQLLDYERDFTWYNIELDAHLIVYAEGVAVESYLEVGDNRNSYDNAAEFHQLYPHHVVPEAMDKGRITLKRQLPSLRKAAA